VLNRANLLIIFVAVLGAALGLVAGSRFGQPPEISAPAGMSILKPGDMRADLQLPDVDGQPRQLSDWDGKLVLLNFWATWCGPCREEMPLLSETGRKFSRNGLQVVGIAIDEADAVKDFLKDSPVRYPILIGGDDDPNASLLFGDTRSVLPYSVLIGRDGKVLAQRAGSFSPSELAGWLQPHLGPQP
jgi:thiol-disulfide isomerase/thioredoxin